MVALPIDPYLPQIVAAVRSRRAVILSAAPGAGKTTRVPPALAADGAVLVLQPRRVAARSMARRIAAEQGWTLGREVGWHVRFERRFTSESRVVFATEGILTARLQQDPLLADFTTIVLDEFHERSVHADVGLALARQAWRARDDLRLVVMSATLESSALAAFLNECPVIAVPGRLHPLDLDYRPGQSVTAAVRDVLQQTLGNVLCFLPGAPEINRALPEVRAATDPSIDVVPLHGSLPADEQDRAIAEAERRRVILATNIAETSLTVAGVTAVIDAGYQKVARFDPDRGIDSLELERIPADSAEQRAGRAGRLGPGRVRRLWDHADRLRPRGEPEIHRIDLSETVLDILAWGGDPRSFEWFDAPDADRIDAALALLGQLGAVRDGKVTALGVLMKGLPLHPRLSRMLLESAGSRQVALACALLSERHAWPRHGTTTTSDLLTAVDDARGVPPHAQEVARRIGDLAREAIQGSRATSGEAGFLRAIFTGYPDRVARRREPGSPRFLLASGHGAVLGRDSGVRDAEFIVAIDVQAGRRGEGAEALIRIASAVDPGWLEPTDIRLEHAIVDGRVRATARTYYGAIPLVERPGTPDAAETSRLLAETYRARGWRSDDQQLFRRMRFAQLDVDEDKLLLHATAGKKSLDQIDLPGALEWSSARELDRRAPQTLPLPSGRAARLLYHEDGSVSAAVKLQELFGLAESPRLGPGHEPVVFELLAPNGRAVQTTRDLRSFWNTTYQGVRKELRGRYPRHPWPEDPWTAPPTARAKPHR
ncbi:MAG TPA: ATP-dependent helicase HrpB [Vicinamibacterales bacterium]|nr:ATP-dependent helicase HrpB [Vicinamibacterales bacterium]